MRRSSSRVLAASIAFVGIAASLDAQVLIRRATRPEDGIPLERTDSVVRAFRPALPAVTTGGECVAFDGTPPLPRWVAYYPSKSAAHMEVMLWVGPTGALERAVESRSSVAIPVFPPELSLAERTMALLEHERITDRTTLILDVVRDEAQAFNARRGLVERAVGAKIGVLTSLPGFEGAQEQVQRALSLCSNMRVAP